MDITNHSQIYGIPSGILYGQFERTEEINTRIYDRVIPDQKLSPNFDPRSVPTKQSLFPVVNRRTPVNVSIDKQPTYNVEQGFNPGNLRAPPSGFLKNVDTETILRNQTFALQKGGIQNVYIPSSQSDLYNTSVPVPSRHEVQPHPDLFTLPSFAGRVNNNVDDTPIGKDKFFNHTRTQLRNM
jgi:hypothetical protein